MKKLALLVIGLSAAVATAAMADTPATTDNGAMATAKPVKAIKPAELTCAEFLSYDEVTRPQIVYWSEGLNSNGKPEDSVIDVERTNRLVPVLVEDCTREPKSSYWQKMKQEFKRIF
jgi:acid stress chaperone HdeA